MLAGCFLGASYIYTRNLCFPIALHWFWNWIQGSVLGYKVSGNEFSNKNLLILHFPEENLINGGTFGFEGSILCSLLLVLGTVIILRHYYKGLGSDMNLSASWERCTSPFSLMPMSTNAPKLVMFPTMPGNSMPSRRSLMVRTFLSNSKTGRRQSWD